MIVRLLKSETSERLGNLSGGPSDLKKHEYFEDMDLEQLTARGLVSPWIPDPKILSVTKPLSDTKDAEQPPVPAEVDALFADW